MGRNGLALSSDLKICFTRNLVPLFLGCALPMWWNGLPLSWGFKKCIIYGYRT